MTTNAELAHAWELGFMTALAHMIGPRHGDVDPTVNPYAQED